MADLASALRCHHRRALSRAAALLLVPALGAVPAQADEHASLAGPWTAEGREAGEAPGSDPSYTGSVVLAVEGDSLTYAGEMDGETYTGIGIWDPATGTLALHFVEEGTGRPGIAHFVLDGDTLDGRWAFIDAPRDQGVEIWTRADE